MKPIITQLLAWLALSSQINAATLAKHSSPLTVELSAEGHNITWKHDTENVQHGRKSSQQPSRGKIPVFQRRSVYIAACTIQNLTLSTETQASFRGTTVLPDFDAMTPEDFTILPTGSFINITVDPTELLDLTEGGDWDLIARGVIQLADLSSTTLNGDFFSYSSNVLRVPVSAEHAEGSLRRVTSLFARNTADDNCNAAQRIRIDDAEKACALRSSTAHFAALDDKFLDKFEQYFKSRSQADRRYVADRFTVVSNGCGDSKGPVKVGCKHTPLCDKNVLGYATGNRIVMCPKKLFFTSKDIEQPRCSGTMPVYDPVHVMIHEMVHQEVLMKPFIVDKGYGFQALELDHAKAMLNADTYALFAASVDFDCPVKV